MFSQLNSPLHESIVSRGIVSRGKRAGAGSPCKKNCPSLILPRMGVLGLLRTPGNSTC